jgi:hypothetical protein
MQLPVLKTVAPTPDFPRKASVEPAPKAATLTPPPVATSALATLPDNPVTSAADEPTAVSSAQTAPKSTKPVAADPRVPGTWDAIKLGSLVLATTGLMEGWFESLIVATRADDGFLLRRRDWPEEPEFTRRRDELALLHPATDPQG